MKIYLISIQERVDSTPLITYLGVFKTMTDAVAGLAKARVDNNSRKSLKLRLFLEIQE